MHEFPHEADDDHLDRRKSDIFGEIRLYGPNEDPSTWKGNGLLLVTQHGDWKVQRRTVERIGPDGLLQKVDVVTGTTVEDRSGPGIKVLVRSEEAARLFRNTHHLTMADLWEDETAEVASL